VPTRHAASLPDDGAEDYDLLSPAVWNPVSNAVVAAADILLGERVLDVFAGTGAATIPAAQLAGPDGRVDAVDRSSAMLAVAEGKAGALGLGNVAFHRSEPAGWTGDAPYDVLVSCYGVFLLDDMDAGMDRLVQLLAPGGRCAVSAWDEGALEPFGQLLLESIVASTAAPGAGEVPQVPVFVEHCRRLASAEKLRVWLEDRGLADVTVERLGLTVPLAPSHAWSLALGSGYRGLLPDDADTRRRVQDTFLARLGDDFVLNADTLIAVGLYDPTS
jgi:ubiquinone/menaquinone biosynthesis C-methylase UbiE